MLTVQQIKKKHPLTPSTDSSRPKRLYTILDHYTSELSTKISNYNQNIASLQSQNQLDTLIFHSDLMSSWTLNSSTHSKAFKGVIPQQRCPDEGDSQSEPMTVQSEEFDESGRIKNHLTTDSKKIIEQAKNEANILKRVAQLRNKGLWSIKRLPKIKEADRKPAHWDSLLAEMKWMAGDFHCSFTWRRRAAHMAAKSCSKVVKQKNKTKKITSPEQKSRSMARTVAQLVENFWDGIEKIERNLSASKNCGQSSPKTLEKAVICDLSPRQRRLYDECLELLRNCPHYTTTHCFEDLDRICNHPNLVKPRSLKYSLNFPPILYKTSGLVVDMKIPPKSKYFPNLLELEKFTAEEVETIGRLKVGRELINDVRMIPEPRDRIREIDIEISREMANNRDFVGHSRALSADNFNKHSRSILLESIRGFSGQYRRVSFRVGRVDVVAGGDCGDWEEGKAELVASWNERNHLMGTPLYGRDLISCLNVYKTSDKASSVTLLSNVGELDSAELYMSTTTPVWDLVTNGWLREWASLGEMLNCVKSRVFGLPARMVTPDLRENVLREVSGRISGLFPDRRLLEQDSGKLRVLDDLLVMLRKRKRRVVILSKMAEMLDILEDFMNLHFYTYLRIDGKGMLDLRSEMMNLFKRDSSYSFCLVHSILDGLDISDIDCAIYYDTVWSMSDLWRGEGQTVFRLVNQHTLEEKLVKKKYLVSIGETHLAEQIGLSPFDGEIAGVGSWETPLEGSFLSAPFGVDYCRQTPIQLYALKHKMEEPMDDTVERIVWEDLQWSEEEYDFEEEEEEEDVAEPFDLICDDSEDYAYGQEVPEVYLPAIVPDSIVPVEMEHTEKMFSTVSKLGRRCKLRRNEVTEQPCKLFTLVDENTTRVEPRRRSDRKLSLIIDAKQEWLIDEEWAILQTSRRLLLRSNFSGKSISANWNLSCQTVSVRTGCVLSPKLISSRFYSTIGPREEGKYLTELNTRKAVRGRFIFPKTNKQIRTDELYFRDDGVAMQDSADKIISLIGQSHHRLDIINKSGITLTCRISDCQVVASVGLSQLATKKMIIRAYHAHMCKKTNDEITADKFPPSRFKTICSSTNDSIAFFTLIPRRYTSLPPYHIKDQTCKFSAKPLQVYATCIGALVRNNSLRSLLGMMYHHYVKIHCMNQAKPVKAQLPHVNMPVVNYQMTGRVEQERMMKGQYRRPMEPIDHHIQQKNMRPIIKNAAMVDVTSLSNFYQDPKNRMFVPKGGHISRQYIQQNPNMRPIVAYPGHSPSQSPRQSYSLPSGYIGSQRPQMANFQQRIPQSPKISRQMTSIYSNQPRMSYSEHQFEPPMRHHVSSAYMEEHNRRNSQISYSQRTPVPQQIRTTGINLTNRTGIPLVSVPRRPSTGRGTTVGILSSSNPTVISSESRPIKLRFSNATTVRPHLQLEGRLPLSISSVLHNPTKSGSSRPASADSSNNNPSK